ncbi:MAG: DUF4212 domain-containing protein [Verrucomicrobiota bacterium]
MVAKKQKEHYWKLNLLVLGLCLFIAASASFGCGIFWVEPLNSYKLPGTDYPLGFWFAQQGSIIVFVLLILTYALVMNRIDRAFYEPSSITKSDSSS